MFVKLFMSKNPVTISPRDNVATAWGLLKGLRYRRLPVTENGQLVGILSEYDLRHHVKLTRPARLPVEVVMTQNPVYASPLDSIEHAATLMRTYRIGSLPVVDDGELVGIICASDLMMEEPRPLPEWKAAPSIPTVRVDDLFAQRKSSQSAKSLWDRRFGR
ncbi:MAG TPA: CBS domain-containing protein [Candidatus Binataceae bacterium]|nr:CBS domain-containing protein [Candidatus Binataceae bacterium]